MMHRKISRRMDATFVPDVVPPMQEVNSSKSQEQEQEKNKSTTVKFKASIIPQIMVTFAATLGAFGMGTMEAYTSPALPSMEKSGAFGPLPPSLEGQIASLAFLAAAVSGLPVGILIDKIGRKIVLILLTLPFITGWLIIGSATSLQMLYLGRVLTGFCSGAVSLAVPIYVSEASGNKIRGRCSSMFQLMVTCGNLFCYSLGSFLDWQWLGFSCAFAPFLSLILLLWVPESPRYLLTKGKGLQASASLMWLRSGTAEDVEDELKSIEASLSFSAKKKSTFRDFFKMRTLKPMSICLLLFFFQQMTGIEAVLNYSVSIFREAGSDLDPNLCTVIVGALQVFATLSSACFVDKAGRRKLLLVSQLGTACSMTALTAFFFYKEADPSIVEGFGWIPLCSLCSFIALFAIGAGPIPFIMISELNSAQMVGIASSVGTAVNWGFSYLVSFLMMYLKSKYGGMHYCFGLFSLVSYIGVAFVWRFCPETKGRSMEDIQMYFQKVKVLNVLTVSGLV